MREEGNSRGAGSGSPHHGITSSPHHGAGEGLLTAVLVMNYGGPERAEDCRPYLRNIFMDPDLIPIPALIRPVVASLVARRRAPTLAANYAAMGRFSPTLEETKAQAEALGDALGGGFRCYVGMRYWKPFIAEACSDIVRSGCRRVVLLPIYPHESVTTTGSSIREARRCLVRLGYTGEVSEIRHFWDDPSYLEALSDQLREALAGAPEGARVLFSSHGLPVSVAERDPYPGQVLDTVLAVCAESGVALTPIALPGVEDRSFAPPDGARWQGSLAWQSKVGPMKWLEPSVETVLKAWAGQGVKHIVLMPVAFVNEHSETLYELDVLYGGEAKALGMTVNRLPALGVHPGFITGLAERVRQRVNEPTSQR